MLPLPTLLAPVSPAAPCGEDPSLSVTLLQLETLAQGKPETMFSKAEPPDWKAVVSEATKVAGSCKDLRVAAILTAGLMRTGALEGLRDGLQLIRGYLESYWDSVYPRIDPSDQDPSERVNVVANLGAPLGTDGEFLRMVEGLRVVPVLIAPQSGRLTLEHYLAAKGQLEWAAERGVTPTLPLLEAGMKEAGPAVVAERVAQAQAVLQETKAIAELFKTRFGPTVFPQLEPLEKEVKTLLTWFGGAAPGAPAAISAPLAAPGAAASSTGTTASGAEALFTGEIVSREDVVRAFDAVIRYYGRHEPSSPVPFLVKRAKRIAQMNFLELITELSPDSMDRITSVTGRTEDTPSP